jgi:hypothetical protein
LPQGASPVAICDTSSRASRQCGTLDPRIGRDFEVRHAAYYHRAKDESAFEQPVGHGVTSTTAVEQAAPPAQNAIAMQVRRSGARPRRRWRSWSEKPQ